MAAAERADPSSAVRLALHGEMQTAVFKVGYSEDGKSAEAVVREVLEALGAHAVELARASGDAFRRATRDDYKFDDSILEQERSCGALLDVVTARFTCFVSGEALMSRLSQLVLDHRGSDSARVLDVRLLAGTELHAEAHCTTRVYHYLLPLWALEPTWPRHRCEDETVNVRARPFLRRIKETLRTVMDGLDSRCEPHIQGDNEETALEAPNSLTSGRTRAQRFGNVKLYGSESRKEFRWHNFTRPGISANLNPHNVTVRCALDRIFVRRANTALLNGEMFVVLGLQGDHFLVEQCRRLAASLVCVHRGWLPTTFLQTALRRDVVVSTPMAPGHLLYLADCLYAAWARKHGQIWDRSWIHRARKGGFKSKPAPDFTDFGGAPNRAQKEWRGRLLEAIAEAEFKPGAGRDGGVGAWLRELERAVAPRIRQELEVIAALDDFAAGTWRPPRQLRVPPADDCPKAYREVLRLLRQLRAGGLWPPTSQARAKVVRAGDGGSFSLATTTEDKANRYTAAFPELAAAVFALERAIMPSGREPSTWVAVNHNALFSPHTDAGAGMGQTRSLIVGLGAYAGGKLVVEGEASDIRYNPLQFDGWRQRHWTLPYVGERFTLVWFTPLRTREQ